MGYEEEIRILRPVSGGLLSRTRARVSNFAHGGITPEEARDRFIGPRPLDPEPGEMDGVSAAARSVVVFAQEHPENPHPVLQRFREIGR